MVDGLTVEPGPVPPLTPTPAPGVEEKSWLTEVWRTLEQLVLVEDGRRGKTLQLLMFLGEEKTCLRTDRRKDGWRDRAVGGGDRGSSVSVWLFLPLKCLSNVFLDVLLLI